ncbi:MAG: hypothetical protein WA825_08940 [Steroidobacteraceae bacterium]
MAGYTNTAEVQGRLQEGWSELEEQALRTCNAEYVQICNAIAEMTATANRAALLEPHRMAKGDPEFVAAAWQFDREIRALDDLLAL